MKLTGVKFLLAFSIVVMLSCSSDSTGPSSDCITFDYTKGYEWCCVYLMEIDFQCDEEIDYFDVQIFDNERQETFIDERMSASYGSYRHWYQCFCHHESSEFVCSTGSFTISIDAIDENGKQFAASFPMMIDCP